MTRRSFRSELTALIFILSSHPGLTTDLRITNVLNDFKTALACCNVKKNRKYLMWGLLIGRSLDTFTVFFLDAKRARPVKWFNDRILRICDPANPLTSDPTIEADLLRVQDNRNDLFHTAGRHFNDGEMEDFVFTSTKCMQQLIGDLP
jgi:hypothetical protein